MKQKNITTERWKSSRTINCSDYEISDLGRVRNVNTGKYLSLKPHKHLGYVIVQLKQDDGTYRTYQVARLVKMIFDPEANMDSLEVDHISGKSNNLDNLQWVSHKQNCLRIKDHNYHYRKQEGYFQVITPTENSEEIKDVIYYSRKNDMTFISDDNDLNTVNKCLQYGYYSKRYKSWFYFKEDLPLKYYEFYLNKLQQQNRDQTFEWIRKF